MRIAKHILGQLVPAVESTEQGLASRLKMWSTKCPRDIGLKCDCAVQYMTLAAMYVVAVILVVLGLSKLVTGECALMINCDHPVQLA